MLRFTSLVLLLVFSGFHTSAQTTLNTESVLVGANPQGEKVYLIRYLENRVWHVEEVVQHADGWQDLLSRKYFHTRDQAEKAQVQLQAKLIHIQRVQPWVATSSEMVLQGGSIWATTQSWNWDWEKKYAQWLTENMDSGFFKKYNIATDCADVAYGARWIFARIHGLPVANRLSGGGAMITNQSLRSEWANLPTAKNWHEDKRFRAALNYVLNMTYTHTLMRDSYPVAIKPESFLPGVHHLDLRESSGHTQLVHRVDISEQGLVPFLIVESTVPRKVRELNESLFWGQTPGQKGKSAFLRLLWPQVKNGSYSLAKPENMPDYSLEQFDKGFIREENRTNGVEVMLRLKPTLDFVNVLKSGYQNLKDMIQARVTIVEEGYRQCPKRSCAPEGALYDAWSTPSRDKHIKDLMSQLSALNMMPLPIDVEIEMNNVTRQAMESVALQLGADEYPLGTIYYAWFNDLYSSNPNDEPGLRWGLAPEFFSLRMQNNLKKYLAERKAQISKQGEAILKRDFALAQDYCGNFADALCQRFKDQELVRPLAILGQTKTLQEWLEQSLWLNSDPKQSLANQWGALRNQSKFQMLSKDVGHFEVSKEGIGFMKMKNGSIKMGPLGIKGLEDHVLPTGFQWSFFQNEGSVGWATAPGQILKYDFKSKNQTVFATPFLERAEVLFFTQDSAVVVKTASEIWSLQLTGSIATALWKDALMVPALFGSVIIASQNGAWKILDFSSAVPQTFSSGEDLMGAVVFKNTPRYLGVVANRKTFFIEKGSGSVRDASHLGGAIMWSENLTKVIQWNQGVYLGTLDAQFNIISSQKIADFGVVTGEYVQTFFLNQPGKLYKMQGEDLVEIPARSDEEFITEFAGSWLVAKIKTTDDKFRLRSLDGSQILYEGNGFKLLPDQSEMRWIITREKSGEDLHLIDLKNVKGGALMTGEFYSGGRSRYGDELELPAIGRGVVVKYQSTRFWVEFP